MLDEPPLPLSAPAAAAFDAATRVVFEHDISQPPDVSFARLPPGVSLASLISPALYAAVEDRCRDWSLNIDNMARVSPWLVALTLSGQTAKLAGMSSANGVDRNLLPVARSSGKEVEFLEDTAEALRHLGSAPLPEQQRLLALAAEDVQASIDYHRRLIGAWKARRADQMLACAEERSLQTPALYRTLTEDRNQQWLARLFELARNSEPTLVVAGALHMLGPTGLPALLRKSGDEVIAVDVLGR